MRHENVKGSTVTTDEGFDVGASSDGMLCLSCSYAAILGALHNVGCAAL